MARPATSTTGLFSGRPSTGSMRLLSGFREPVRLVSTANINISVGGLLTIDEVVCVAGNRILLANQTDGTENGIYTAAAGPWYRASDARSGRAITTGVQVRVQQGTLNRLTTWEFRTTDPVIGTDVISVASGAVTTFGFGILDMLTMGGTADALIATFNPPVQARRSGQMLHIRTTAINTGAMTINPDGFGVISIKMPDGSAIGAGAVQANTDYYLRDDGVNYRLQLSNITF